jgi:hypothetical protein
LGEVSNGGFGEVADGKEGLGTKGGLSMGKVKIRHGLPVRVGPLLRSRGSMFGPYVSQPHG